MTSNKRLQETPYSLRDQGSHEPWRWNSLIMNTSEWIAIIAVIFSIISFAMSFILSARSSKAAIRPVIVIIYSAEQGWLVRNVGNGPALNLVVALKNLSGVWLKPVRIPPMSASGEFILTWIGHENDHGIGVYYEDFQGHGFTSSCSNDLTRIAKGSLFPEWKDEHIGRHWWDDPVRPTVPGEIRGEWNGA